MADGEKGVRLALAFAIGQAGSQMAFAKKARVSTSFVNDVLHGRRNVTAPILKAIGYERVTIYRKKEPAHE